MPTFTKEEVQAKIDSDFKEEYTDKVESYRVFETDSLHVQVKLKNGIDITVEVNDTWEERLEKHINKFKNKD